MQLNEKRTIMISGLPQRIHLWGKDTNAPVILFLHGGPGMPFRHKIRKYLLPLAEEYVLAVIDERGAGGSYSPELTPADLTLENYVNDIREWTEYLKKRFNHKKIYLVGFSFGSLIGSVAAFRDPSSYAAYLGVGQFVDIDELILERYRLLCQKAREIGDESLERRLEEMGEPVGGKFKTEEDNKYFGDHYYQAMEPAHYPSFNKREIAPVKRSLEYTFLEKRNFEKGLALSSQAKGMSFGVRSVLPLGFACKIPHYIIQGVDDISTPYRLAEEYSKQIHAPKKAFLAYTNSGHEALFEEPERFMIDVRNKFNENVD